MSSVIEIIVRLLPAFIVLGVASVVAGVLLYRERAYRRRVDDRLRAHGQLPMDEWLTLQEKMKDKDGGASDG